MLSALVHFVDDMLRREEKILSMVNFKPAKKRNKNLRTECTLIRKNSITNPTGNIDMNGIN